jgi:hypothetical protein
MNKFHIVLVGCSVHKFVSLMSHVRDQCDYRVSYIVSSSSQLSSLRSIGIRLGDIYNLREHNIRKPNSEEIDYLSSLEEAEGVPTIHNMIMSDRIVSKLPYGDGIAYAAHLARNLKLLFKKLKPSVVAGGHDSLHASMGFAVAKAEAIPWFAFNFSTIPVGFAALSDKIIAQENICLRYRPDEELREMAEALLEKFENKFIKVPAYVSAYNIRMVISRLNEHMFEAFKSLIARCSGRLDKYSEYDIKFLLSQYWRKRRNMLTVPKQWFIKEPPSEPFVFFGLHMQPESSIDVNAPFYANQFDVIEKMARSIPPTYKLLVKLHISDADNYSCKQLWSLRCLPGVKLVLPNVSSRAFIERSSAIITIAGTMGLEGALLGKPVVVFGTTTYQHFPSVTRVADIRNLPQLIRSKLSEPRPSRASIIEAYKKYLNPFFQADKTGSRMINDWTTPHVTREEKDCFIEIFQSLEKYLLGEVVTLKHFSGTSQERSASVL